MSNKIKTAIVILNWNGASLLQQFLPQVIRHSSGDDIALYVADNGSTDDSVTLLRNRFPQVNVVELGVNHGFAKGYNLALQQVEATYYVLINSDIEVTPNWLYPCITQLDENPDMAALQPKIRSYTDRNRFEYAGAAGGYIDQWGFPFCRGRVLSETEEDTGQYDQPVSLFWATGACLIIRAEAFRNTGGFDEDFFAHMEEIDLCWRLKNQGWKIGFQPQSMVYHVGGATLSYHSPKKLFLNFRNNLWMLVKNLPERKMIPVVFIRLLLDGIAAFRFLATGQVRSFMAVFQAHMVFWGSLGRVLDKRNQLVPKVTRNHHPEIFRGSMVFRFYIMKQKRFTDLGFFVNTEPYP